MKPRSLGERPDKGDDDVEVEDARRCRCIRVGSTSGILARRANNDNTVNVLMVNGVSRCF